MIASPPNIARQLSGLRVRVHMQYMKANVMPFPSKTAASGARNASGAMAPIYASHGQMKGAST